MGGLTPSYAVVGIYNPLGIYPARVYPIFKMVSSYSDDGNRFRQLADITGVVGSFIKVKSSNSNLVVSMNANGPQTWLGQPAIFGFAISEQEIFFAKGLSEFKDQLRSFLSPQHRSKLVASPIAGVEIARFLDSPKSEAVFAGLTVRMLSVNSFDLAEGWLHYAPLSQNARERGQRVLLRLERLEAMYSQMSLTQMGAITPSYSWRAGRSTNRTRTIRTHSEGQTPWRSLKNFSSLHDAFAIRRAAAGDVYFVHWKDIAEVTQVEIQKACASGASFVVAFEDVNEPFHKHYLSNPSFHMVRSKDRSGLNEMVLDFQAGRFEPEI